MSQPACRARTKRGTTCRGFALPGRDVCLMHAPDLADKVEAARRRGGTMAAKVRVLQGKRQKLDSPRALVRFVSDLLQDTLAGTVDPKVANAVINGVNAQRALLEAGEIEGRLADLERVMGAMGRRGAG